MMKHTLLAALILSLGTAFAPTSHATPSVPAAPEGALVSQDPSEDATELQAPRGCSARCLRQVRACANSCHRQCGAVEVSCIQVCGTTCYDTYRSCMSDVCGISNAPLPRLPNLPRL
jgi:hypothetical protein